MNLARFSVNRKAPGYTVSIWTLGGRAASGYVVEQFDYLLYGEKCINSGLAVANSNKTEYLYGGKELPQLFGIDWYDSAARWQTTSGVFTSPDPLMELSTNYSPYSYSSCNPVNYIDPYGLTYYRVGGEVFDIDDGFDDEIEVTKSEYRRLKNRFKYSDSLYIDYRQQVMDKNGYTTGDGQYVLPASYSVDAAPATGISPFYCFASAAALDLSIPDLTDVYLPKIGIEAVVVLASSAYSTQALVEKRDREIEALKRRSPGPMGEQYALIATADGYYISYTYGGGLVYLKTGDVWKYGETTQGNTRYSQAWKDKHNVEMITQKVGPQREMKIEEKRKIYQYFIEKGHLPPGNKIFR